MPVLLPQRFSANRFHSLHSLKLVRRTHRPEVNFKWAAKIFLEIEEKIEKSMSRTMFENRFHWLRSLPGAPAPPSGGQLTGQPPVARTDRRNPGTISWLDRWQDSSSRSPTIATHYPINHFSMGKCQQRSTDQLKLKWMASTLSLSLSQCTVHIVHCTLWT